ncbi:hypothetical protein [Rhodohalobacter sp. 8-1]|uniref:hypothetical protein n=1 Tax=Rhodohalobacter sp. 8-1 TaxID=3131972 RepID=UPI0030EC58E6
MLKKVGVEFLGEIEEFDYGKSGWIMEPNGYKIELRKHNYAAYDKIKGDVNASS